MNWDSRTGRLLERAAIIVASLVISFGAIALLSGYFQSNDQAGITGSTSGPGQTFPDQGDQILPSHRLQPPYNSDPPTSGPHMNAPVTHDAAQLSDYQLLTALAAGNVVIAYGDRTPPAGLRQLARAVAGPFTTALAADGQAVILDRIPGATGLIGLAWRHMVTVGSPTLPLLSQFARFYLGKGAAAGSSPHSLPAS